jgi:ketosteroid isomerase-like protein
MENNAKLARHFEMVARGEIAVCAACVNRDTEWFEHCPKEASYPKFAFDEGAEITPRDYVPYLTKI